MKKFFHRLTLCMLLGAWSLSSHADVVLNSTNFPDPVFRELLKSKLLRAEGETITNAQIADLKSFNTKDPSINPRKLKVASLKGIEYFTSLEELGCYDNELTELDVKALTNLKKLICLNNNIKKLELDRASKLEYLDCSQNKLTTLKLANSEQTAMEYINCSVNELTSLNVSAYTNLRELHCILNDISSPLFNNLSKQTKLKTVTCFKNRIPYMNCSALTGLRRLECANNQMTYLVVPDQLDTLDCSKNQLTQLDLSNCSYLKKLDCSDNHLTKLVLNKSDVYLKEIYCQLNELRNLSAMEFKDNLPSVGSGTLYFTLLNDSNSLTESQVKELNEKKGWSVQVYVPQVSQWTVYKGIIAYELDIAGLPVTNLNNNDVLGDGMFSYDPAKKLLTVKKKRDGSAAVCTTTGGRHNPPVRNAISGLTIEFLAPTRLESNAEPMMLETNTTLKGENLELISSENRGAGLYCNANCNVTLDGIYVLSAGQIPIYATSNLPTLVLQNGASLRAEGTRQAFYNFKITLKDGIQMATPAGGVIKDGTVYETDGTTPAKTVILMKPIEHTYLYVDGTEVLPGNQNDVLGNGAFSYDPNSKTLTVKKNYTGNTSINSIISNKGIEGLTINVPGYVTLAGPTSSYSDVISSNYNLTITGGGTLNVKSKDKGKEGIYLSYGTMLTIADVTLNTEGYRGIYSSGNSPLVVDHAHVTAKSIASTSKSAIEGFMTLTMNGVTILSDGVTLDKNGQFVKDGAVASEVEIGTKTYSIMLNDGSNSVVVDENNKNDVFGNGVFSYVCDTKTLNIAGNGAGVLADIFYPSFIATTDADRIAVTKPSNLSGLDGMDYALAVGGSTITGPASLTLQKSLAAFNGGSLTLDGAEIYITGTTGIIGMEGEQKTSLTISNSYLNIETDDAAVSGFTGGITLKDCIITYPEGGYVKNGVIVDQRGNAAKKVVIEPCKSYDLTVCGTRVTERNMNDILGNGVFAFNPETRVLTVSGNYGSKDNTSSIVNKLENLTINTVKDSELFCYISTYGKLTLTGPGKLRLSANNCVAGITLDSKDASLTLDGADLEIDETYNNGITTNSSYKSTLTIRQSRLTITKSPSGPVEGFAKVELTGCNIIYPKDITVKDLVFDEEIGFTPSYGDELRIGNPADVNRDGTVDSADIVAVIKEMPDGDKKADVNGDGVIDSADIVAVIKAMK